MKRVKLKIAYDGTDFHGFAKQTGLRTVEGELNKALSLAAGEDILVTGLSRTDAGVHALGNEVVFDTDSSVPPEKFMYAALRYLPEDLRIISGTQVPSDYNIRKQDVIKTYEYRLYCGKVENPLTRRYFAYSDRVPDIGKMREAAGYLIGEHDFTSFANPASYVFENGLSAVRKIYGIEINAFREDGMPGEDIAISIKVSGNGFLYNMVRIIAGTLFNAGFGFTEPRDIPEILAAKDRTKAGPTMEARGLRLLGVARYSWL